MNSIRRFDSQLFSSRSFHASARSRRKRCPHRGRLRRRRRPRSSPPPASVTVPFILDHNRMLVDMEIQRADGTWRAARIWIDTGEPRFFMSEALARDLGIDLPGLDESGRCRRPSRSVSGECRSISRASKPWWSALRRGMYNTMHNDGHISSRVLQRYQVVFDYPARLLTIAAPGTLGPAASAPPRQSIRRRASCRSTPSSTATA